MNGKYYIAVCGFDKKYINDYHFERKCRVASIQRSRYSYSIVFKYSKLYSTIKRILML